MNRLNKTESAVSNIAGSLFLKDLFFQIIPGSHRLEKYLNLDSFLEVLEN